MTSDLRREAILAAAKQCFARHGFAGTTTRSVAAAAGISEGLLFKHFPSKSALYAEILAEACEADPGLHELLDQPPSTATLVTLIGGMVAHFFHVAARPDQEDAQRLRLLMTSHLDDGEFARLLYAKIGALIGPIFEASLARAVACGDARAVGQPAIMLFWYAHEAIMMAALSRLPPVPCLPFAAAPEAQRHICEFILRGVGLTEAAIASHIDRALPTGLLMPPAIAESA